MTFNTYVRNGSVVRSDSDGWKLTLLFGEKVFDPVAMIQPCCIPRHLHGRPHEIVLHIAGETYYPTTKGYVKI